MRSAPRQKRTPRPLDAARLDELALAYVARFAVSAAKLETYLKRKLRERGWGEEGEPPLQEILSRFVRAGYVDDAAYARMKAGSLRRRGYGERRVDQALGAAGIEETLREEVRAGEGEQRRAAVALARRRRFGPWAAAGDPGLERALREKQLAAMLRAGHRLDIARAVIHGADSQSVESWAQEDAEE